MLGENRIHTGDVIVVSLLICGVACLISMFGSILSEIRCLPEGEVEVEVEESYPIVAFEQGDGSSTEFNMSEANFLIYRSMSGDITSNDGTYEFMVDEYGDGGMIRKTLDADKVRVYEDAEAEDARLEIVEVVTGNGEHRIANVEYETRIHIPKGTLQIQRLNENKNDK